MALGSKRSAPEDFDSSAAPHPVTRSRPFTPSEPPSQSGHLNASSSSGAHALDTMPEQQPRTGYDMETWIWRLEGRLIDAEEEDGPVVLGTDEATHLLLAMKETIARYLEAPASRADIVQLMEQLSRITDSRTAESSPCLRRPDLHAPTPTRKPSLFASLPYDVLRLILLELRELYRKDYENNETSYLVRSGLHSFWTMLPVLANYSTSLREICMSLYRSELVLVDVQDIPTSARKYAESPSDGQALRRMSLRLLDFEYAFSRSGEDAGFALPELISAAPNLQELVLASHRTSTFGSSERFSRMGRTAFETLTGGISMPDTIVTSLASSLRSLVYGAPCSLADVVTFASAMTSLESLDVVGPVDHARRGPGIKTVASSLRRLWLPSTALSAAELGAFLAADDALEPDCKRDVRVDSLAFTFDPEHYFAPVPPPGDIVAHEIEFLGTMFGLVGGKLRELSISMPMADNPEGATGRIRIAGGGGGPGGGWMQQGGFMVAILGGGGPGGGPGGAAAGGGEGGPGAPQGQGRGQAGPAGQGAPPPPVAEGGAGAAGGADGGPPIPRRPPAGDPLPAPGRPRAAPGPGPGPAANPPIGNNNNPANGAPPIFNLFNPLTWAGLGGGGGGAGAGPGAAGVAAPNIPEVEPFFERLLQHTPLLEHLELYGRRYTADVFDKLKQLPLRHLALSVPEEEREQERIIDELIAALGAGKWPDLRRIELSSRGGDWQPAQRRAVKREAEKRSRLVYKSTDIKA